MQVVFNVFNLSLVHNHLRLKVGQKSVEIFDGAVVIFVLESGRRVLGSLGHLNIDKLLSTVLFKSL